MTLYDELIARGLIAQVTNEDEIKNMINNGKATFYMALTARQIRCTSATSWPCAS